MAKAPGHCAAGDRAALASSGTVFDLGLSVARALARGTSQDRPRDSRPDCRHGPRQLPLGRPADTRRASQAWLFGVAGHGLPLYAGSSIAAIPELADLHSKSSCRHRIERADGWAQRQRFHRNQSAFVVARCGAANRWIHFRSLRQLQPTTGLAASPIGAATQRPNVHLGNCGRRLGSNIVDHEARR